MKQIIEIFAESATVKKKVGCASCPKRCDSRDEVVLTPALLMASIQGAYLDKVEVRVYDFSTGNQEAIMERMNALYKINGVKRVVNKVLIYPLMPKIWPAVVIDDQIKSEGELLDLTQMKMYIDTDRV